MNLIPFLSSVKAPKSLWVTLINWIKASVGNLGWTIILVTVLIKLVTTPLDFWVKFNTKKQTLIQQKCAPQVAKLQKKFGADRQGFQRQSQALYKREGLDMRSGCIVMLINTILSFTIFITFYGDLRKVSAYEAINQYEQIEATYTSNYKTAYLDKSNAKYSFENWEAVEAKYSELEQGYKDLESMEEGNEKTNKKTELDELKAELDSFALYATEVGSDKAVEFWKKDRKNSSWLWVQNIWVADSKANVFPSYDALKSIAKDTGYTNYVTTKIDKTNYNKIASLISENAPKHNNGYYILPILAGVITFLSQYISELHTRLKNKKANKIAKEANTSTASTMKVMRIVLPAIMVIFTLTASASFGLYILASNVATMALGELTTLIINSLTKKKQLEVEADLEKEANRLIKKGQFKE